MCETECCWYLKYLDLFLRYLLVLGRLYQHCHAAYYHIPYYVKSVQIRSFFWSRFSRIDTGYGEILHISPYSVRMRENTNQKNSVNGKFSRSARVCTMLSQLSKTAPRNQRDDSKEDDIYSSSHMFGRAF